MVQVRESRVINSLRFGMMKDEQVSSVTDLTSSLYITSNEICIARFFPFNFSQEIIKSKLKLKNELDAKTFKDDCTVLAICIQFYCAIVLLFLLFPIVPFSWKHFFFILSSLWCLNLHLAPRKKNRFRVL